MSSWWEASDQSSADSRTCSPPWHFQTISPDIAMPDPLFDEHETYRVLFGRYQVLEQTSNYLVFQRRRDAPLPAERELRSLSGRLGDWIQVPAHGDQRLYGRVQVGYSPLGQALT